MNLTVKQTSSLVKIRSCGIGTVPAVTRKTLLRGQTFHYQIALETAVDTEFSVRVESPLAEYVSLYAVKNVVVDLPCYEGTDEDYLTKEPGLMPDLLLPLEDEGNAIRLRGEAGALWVRVKLPDGSAGGSKKL